MDKSHDANGHLYKMQSNLAEKFKNYVFTMDSFVLHFFKKELFPLYFFSSFLFTFRPKIGFLENALSMRNVFFSLKYGISYIRMI